MKKIAFAFAFASLALLAGLPASALLPIASAAMPTQAATTPKKDPNTPAKELAKSIAAVEADMAQLDKMRAAANKPGPNVIAVGTTTKMSDSNPTDCLRHAINHFDEVATQAASLSNTKLATAAKQGKAALEAHKWDDADAALAIVKTFGAKKK